MHGLRLGWSEESFCNSYAAARESVRPIFMYIEKYNRQYICLYVYTTKIIKVIALTCHLDPARAKHSRTFSEI